MINLLIYLGLFAVLVAIAILSRAGAYIFTQIKKPIFNFKPFNCYGCLSFWLTLIFGCVIILFTRYVFETADLINFARFYIATVAFLLGLINYLTINFKLTIKP